MPSLVGVTARIDAEQLRTIVTEGRNNMRAIVDATNEEISAIHAWLEQTNPAGRGSSVAAAMRGGVPLPAGPVVASGGARHPALPARYGGPFYPGLGGTAGNRPWPDDVEAAKLPTRYQSGYNVMATPPNRRTRRSRPMT